MNVLDPIHVYIDGSYVRATGAQAYGWVVANPNFSMTRARIVSPASQLRKGGCTLMEGAAFVDALSEFAFRNRHIVIHGDCQYLAQAIEKFRTGTMDKSDFFTMRLRFEDVCRLLPLIDKLSFEFVWVQGHAGDFFNEVIDKALRQVTVEGRSEIEAKFFAEFKLLEKH